MKKNDGLFRMNHESFCMSKILRIMKLTTLLLLITTLQLLATETYSQKTKLSMDFGEATVEQVLKEIEDNSEFYFLFNQQLIDVSRKVQLKAEDQQIDKILAEVFEGTNVDYYVMDRQIILSPHEYLAGVKSVLQPREVSGTVTDENGEPLIGVTVVIKGTTTGVVTDLDGVYTLSGVSEDDILVFSFVGMITQEVIIGSQVDISVSMVFDAIGIEELVVVGYGIQKKVNVTGSIASVESEELTKIPSTNTSQLLAGRLPGLIVQQRSGQPGDDDANLSIRGFGNALTIVDGIPRDFLQLDPNEIESIVILKDASAAVYGARAGNGVILVTTKKGSRNTAPQINYTGNFSWQRPTSMPKVANAPSYAKYHQQAEKLAGYTDAQLMFPDSEIEKYEAGTEPGYQGADWQDLTFRDWAPFQQHNINVTGGTENVNYFVSLGYLDQQSLLESGAGTFNRFNVTSNVDISITKNLTAKLNLKWRQEDRDDPTMLSDDNEYYRIYRYFTSSRPTQPPIPNEPDLMAFVSGAYENPLAYSRQDISGFTRDKRNQIDLIYTMDYKLPIKGLSVDGTFSLRNNDRYNRNLRKPYSVWEHNYTTGVNTIAASLNENRVETRNWKFNQVTTQFAMRYDNQFGDHNVSGLLLYENIWVDQYYVQASRTDLITGEIPYLFAGNGPQVNTDEPSEDGRSSLVARANYNYKEKYLVEGVFRYDASPRFPEDTRWGAFPGISLGWRMSEEDFMSGISFLDYLKLRVSYASLGYDDISDYDYLTGYEIRTAVGDRYATGDKLAANTLRTIGLANSLITWENMELYNAGVNSVFWSGLLGFDLDVFYRLRSNILATRTAVMPNTFGASLPRENLEKRDHRGFELVLNHRNNFGDFKYFVSGNLTWTREKYVDVVEREFDPNDPDDARLNQQTGQWVNRLFGYETNGFFNSQAEIDAETIDQDEFGNVTLLPGDIRYIDQNGDNVINFRDQVLLGRSNTPELMFGLNIALQYKGFDLDMLWQGAANYNLSFDGFMIGPNLSIVTVPTQYQTDNCWYEDDYADPKLPAPSLPGTNDHNDETNDIFTRDASYLRLKSLNIGYNLPPSVLNKVKISSFRIFAAGYNLITFNRLDIFDVDPEMTQGSFYSTYPVQKMLTLGVTIGL
ncbi:TonB-dependent receptor [Bacteroidota bacterium]